MALALPPFHRATELEKLIADHVGPCRYLSGEVIEENKGVRRNRTYMKHCIQINRSGERKFIFTKEGHAPGGYPAFEQFISMQNEPEFEAPKYYGFIGGERDRIDAWEFVSGNRYREWRKCSREELRRLVEVVSVINGLTNRALEFAPRIPVKTRGIKPMSESIIKYANDKGDNLSGDLAEHIEAFVAIENKALSRFRSIGNLFLSHHDFGPDNILISNENRLLIHDWELAAISSPGSSLRRMTLLDRNIFDELIEYYVECLRTRGMTSDIADVVFSIDLAQIYSSLYLGLQGNDELISWAIQHARLRLNL